MNTGAMADKDPAGFDAWYADMARSDVKDQIVRRRLDLPPEVPATGLLDRAALGEVTAALRLRPGETLLDLGCGRGGYGLEIARRTGADLIGVDFSAEAVRQATVLAAELGRTALFRVGDLAATGLPAGSADAVVCIDAIQFAAPATAAYAEIARVLRPSGRVVITTWTAAVDAPDEVPDRLRGVDPGAGLRGAGLTDVTVTERADWRIRERALWEDAVALDPAGDPALQSFHDEGVRSLGTWDHLHRVLVTATRRR